MRISLRRKPNAYAVFNNAASRNAGSHPLRPAARIRDLLVGVVEQGDQLLAGERAFTGVGLRVGDVHSGVPLMHHLDRVGAEPLLALCRPLIGGIDEVGAEGMDGLLIVAQRRAFEVPDRP
jgi:hypothetical protein